LEIFFSRFALVRSEKRSNAPSANDFESKVDERTLTGFWGVYELDAPLAIT